MIAAKDSIGPRSTDQLPNSRKAYSAGKIHPDLRVPFREISLAPTNGVDGTVQQNEAVRVYDTSGPWGDPAADCDVRTGLPALRTPWILARGDVRGYTGREVLPQDNGYLSRGPRGTRGQPDRGIRPQPSGGVPRPGSPTAAREPGASGDAVVVCAPGDRHPGDGVHRHPRESRARGRPTRRPRTRAARATCSSSSIPGKRSARRSRLSSRRSSSGRRWRADGRSSRPTSTTRSWNR